MTIDDIETLAPAMGDDADIIVREVDEGRATLLRYDDGSRIVARLEEYPEQAPELVIVAGAGAGATEKMAALVAMADERCWTVRFHTKRPALGRMLAGLGFTESERVYRYGRG
ncbi:hypothetical protein [Chromohalobacter israelensis]|uniref:hypothetical protein n=1 Tax=Chromohalobacter israelensis TaxID=141390 RepID=UPI00265C884F|nr:hypothetical protein [Chromohalobacter salexigens]MDO0946635.1 hypothetical protein [Chromohalobacter salexigens]